ncbi:MAG: Maf family nucleotide pyrophosphatase [Hyphomicrobiaceae bacterium]
MTTDRARRRLILASQSRSRRQMLQAAGLSFEAIASTVDEPRLRHEIEASDGDAGPDTIARALAAAKAMDVSRAHPDALVIGGDQVLALGNRIFEKPAGLSGARGHLMMFRGKTHVLVSAVALAEAGQVVWQHAETASLTVRAFSPAFLDRYLDVAGEDVCLSVGAYQLEGLGAQLFERIEGDYFTILGLPLIALLGELRAWEVIDT